MRYALLIGLVACGDGKQAQTVDADPATCLEHREAVIDRSCTTASDCVLVESGDCCGVIVIAVHAGTESSYPLVEAAYDACLACPPVGCAHQDLAEDGSIAQAGQAIVAVCVASRCTSTVQ